jgi:hypothetical protein
MILLERQMIELDDNGFQNPLQGKFLEIRNRVEQNLNPVFCFRRTGRQASWSEYLFRRRGRLKKNGVQEGGRARGMAGQIGICRAST